jgi:hypothetical protein
VIKNGQPGLVGAEHYRRPQDHIWAGAQAAVSCKGNLIARESILPYIQAWNAFSKTYIENLSIADRVSSVAAQHRTARKDNQLDRTTIGQELNVANIVSSVGAQHRDVRKDNQLDCTTIVPDLELLITAGGRGSLVGRKSVSEAWTLFPKSCTLTPSIYWRMVIEHTQDVPAVTYKTRSRQKKCFMQDARGHRYPCTRLPKAHSQSHSTPSQHPRTTPLMSVPAAVVAVRRYPSA